MVLENLTNLISAEYLERDLSYLIKLFEAIGGLILAYFIFNVISIIHNWRLRKEVRQMKILIEKIDRKLNKK
ncbi:hypothetical protein HYW76_01085 [Candidatus Pacearchaeota archaeon]|nr:hypothetical protein [Candidatus Pacearchaeota archaeon]